MVDSDGYKLFLGGLSRSITEEDLRDHFSKYGAVVVCVIARDRVTGYPRGFGFVSFDDSVGFNGALGDCHVIQGRKVDVKRAVPRSEQQHIQQYNKGSSRNSKGNNWIDSRIRTKKIFVGGLSPNLTELEFKSYFQKFGKITDVVVMHDNMTRRPRGFGFITFDSEDSVDEVTRNGFYELNGKTVEVKRAVPKEMKDNGTLSSFNVGSGSGSSSDDCFGNYTPHVMYPYGQPSPFGISFPMGGYYEVARVGSILRPPLIIPSPFIAFRGNPLPYISTVYPMNGGGVGILGPPNGIIMGAYQNPSVVGANVRTARISEIDDNGEVRTSR